MTKSVPDAVSLFYDLVLHFRAKMIPEMRKKAETCESITKVIGGSLPANEGINNLIRQYGLPCRDLNLDEANAIIQSSIRDMFIRSDPRRGMYEEEEPFIEGLRRRLSEQT